MKHQQPPSISTPKNSTFLPPFQNAANCNNPSTSNNPTPNRQQFRHVSPPSRQIIDPSSNPDQVYSSSPSLRLQSKQSLKPISTSSSSAMLLKSPPHLHSNARHINNTPNINTTSHDGANNNNNMGCSNLKSINNSRNLYESASIAKIKTPQSISGIFKSNFRTVASRTPTSNLLMNNARMNNNNNNGSVKQQAIMMNNSSSIMHQNRLQKRDSYHESKSQEANNNNNNNNNNVKNNNNNGSPLHQPPHSSRQLESKLHNNNNQQINKYESTGRNKIDSSNSTASLKSLKNFSHFSRKNILLPLCDSSSTNVTNQTGGSGNGGVMSMIAGPNTATCMSSKKTNFNFNAGTSSISSGCEMSDTGKYKNPIGISAQRASCGVQIQQVDSSGSVERRKNTCNNKSPPSSHHHHHHHPLNPQYVNSQSLQWSQSIAVLQQQQLQQQQQINNNDIMTENINTCNNNNNNNNNINNNRCSPQRIFDEDMKQTLKGKPKVLKGLPSAFNTNSGAGRSSVSKKVSCKKSLSRLINRGKQHHSQIDNWDSVVEAGQYKQVQNLLSPLKLQTDRRQKIQRTLNQNTESSSQAMWQLAAAAANKKASNRLEPILNSHQKNYHHSHQSSMQQSQIPASTSSGKGANSTIKSLQKYSSYNRNNYASSSSTQKQEDSSPSYQKPKTPSKFFSNQPNHGNISRTHAKNSFGSNKLQNKNSGYYNQNQSISIPQQSSVNNRIYSQSHLSNKNYIDRNKNNNNQHQTHALGTLPQLEQSGQFKNFPIQSSQAQLNDNTCNNNNSNNHQNNLSSPVQQHFSRSHTSSFSPSADFSNIFEFNKNQMQKQDDIKKFTDQEIQQEYNNNKPLLKKQHKSEKVSISSKNQQSTHHNHQVIPRKTGNIPNTSQYSQDPSTSSSSFGNVPTISSHFISFKSLAQNKVKLDQMITVGLLKSARNSGPVKKMLHIPSFRLYAVKQVPFSNREVRFSLKNWAMTWQNSINPCKYIVKLHGTYWNRPEGSVSLIMDNMSGGSLQSLLESIGSLPEDILFDITWSILRSLLFLHGKAKVAHGSISPSQIVFDSKGKAKLNLGVSGKISNKNKHGINSPKNSATNDIITPSTPRMSSFIDSNRNSLYDCNPAHSPSRLKKPDFKKQSSFINKSQEQSSIKSGQMIANDIFDLGFTLLNAAVGGFQLLGEQFFNNMEKVAILQSGGVSDSCCSSSFKKKQSVRSNNSTTNKAGSTPRIQGRSYCCMIHASSVSFQKNSSSTVSRGKLRLKHFLNPSRFSKQFLDFLCICLRFDSTKRATANDLLKHQWLNPPKGFKSPQKVILKIEQLIKITHNWKGQKLPLDCQGPSQRQLQSLCNAMAMALPCCSGGQDEDEGSLIAGQILDDNSIAQTKRSSLNQIANDLGLSQEKVVQAIDETLKSVRDKKA